MENERPKVLGYAAAAEAHNDDDDDDDRGADDMPELMTTAEAARHIGVSPGYLTNLRCWGTGPRCSRVGARNVRYVRADLDAWKERRGVGAAYSAPSVDA
jgi:hypothetical protein